MGKKRNIIVKKRKNPSTEHIGKGLIGKE